MRCFLALTIPGPLVPPLLAVQEAVPVGRPVPEENLHVTLAFLDEQDEESLDELDFALQARRLEACTLAVEGLAGFGREPRLLAAELVRAPGLMALRRSVMGAVRAAGIVLPRTRFRPHVTLIRFGSGLAPAERPLLDRALRDVAGLTTPPVPAEKVALMSSTRTEDGALYETLAEYPLPPA
ncbi:RNA 2',3'-cyclic phosphodiesterase, partial [Salipiger mucosus]|uniref:RNA 2',3'-cyclic phosphodiesterase n=1 Tax=Salipiger mucosus TaxID=263378 RepID=UPI000A018832